MQLFDKAKIISQSFLWLAHPSPVPVEWIILLLTLFVLPHSGSEIVTKLFKLLCVGGEDQTSIFVHQFRLKI